MQRIALSVDAAELLAGPRGRAQRPPSALAGLCVAVTASAIVVGVVLAHWWPLSLIGMVVATAVFWTVLAATAEDEPPPRIEAP